VNVQVLVNHRLDHRSYSVVGNVGGSLLTIAVKALPESRGGSRYMWSLVPGDRVRATAPRCAFELSRTAAHYLLLAGGIGITPLVSMAQALARTGAEVHMLYAAHSRAELAYADVLSEMLGDRLRVFPSDEGLALDVAGAIAGMPPDGELYMCGPLRLMDAVRREWAAQERPVTRLRYETFGSSGRFAAVPFTVRIPRLGLAVAVADNCSMLDALTAAGVGVLSDCRRGECGLCVMDVTGIDGEIDHRDVFFSAEQQAQGKQICTCVSRVAVASITVEPAWRGDPDLSKPEVLFETSSLEETS
jgi:vanillate O-demethylase ferredoxin subunit